MTGGGGDGTCFYYCFLGNGGSRGWGGLCDSLVRKYFAQVTVVMEFCVVPMYHSLPARTDPRTDART